MARAGSTSAKKSGGQARDCIGKLFVSLLQPFALGVIPQEDGGVVTDPLGNGVHGNASVE